MTSDIHMLSGAYAIDALDDLERAGFERHIADCPSCQAEVASLREAAAVLPETSVTQPPASLRDRVLAGAQTVRPLPPNVVTLGRARRGMRSLVAAAAAVVVLGGGAAVWRTVDDPPAHVPTATERVLQADDARRLAPDKVAPAFPKGSQATLVVSEDVGRAVILADDMASPPDGKVYQLWFGDTTQVVSAGLMPPKQDAEVLLDGDPRDATWVGITVEPAGGSTHPTSEPIAVFELQEA